MTPHEEALVENVRRSYRYLLRHIYSMEYDHSELYDCLNHLDTNIELLETEIRE